MEIEDIFEGKWTSEVEYLIRCPVCGDHATHDHCSINIVKGIFHCFFKGCSGTLTQLVREYGNGENVELRKGIVEKKKYSLIDFSQFKKITGIEGSNDRLALSYLKTRGINEDEIELYGIKYCSNPTNRYYGRIILPIFENEEIVCLSARSFLPFIRPSYLFPHYGETICTAGEVIWGLEYAQVHSKGAVVLVEGVFDAIAVNQKTKMNTCGLALLNKAMTKSQRNKLLKLDKEVRLIIMLDSDARNDSLKIARELSNYGRQVYLCFLPEGDPASVSQEQYDRTMSEAREFDDELEMEEVL